MAKTHDTVYTSQSELARPRTFLKASFRELSQSIGIAWRIFSRDLAAQYRETILGLFWMWVPALTVSMSFILAQKADLISVESAGIPYPAYVLISTVLWQVFAESFGAPLKAIDAAKPLLTRVRFPAESLILARTFDVVLSFLIKLPILVGVMVWFKLWPSTWILALPLGVFSMMAIGLFLGLLLVPVGGMYQDVTKSMPLVITFWMFMTPVVFTPSVGGLLGKIVALNPVTPLLVASRWFVAGVGQVDWNYFSFVSVVSLAGLFAAWLIVRISIPIIVERAGN